MRQLWSNPFKMLDVWLQSKVFYTRTFCFNIFSHESRRGRQSAILAVSPISIFARLGEVSSNLFGL